MKRTKMDADVDVALVKKMNEEKIWTSFCKICDHAISGKLSELRKHNEECHGK